MYGRYKNAGSGPLDFQRAGTTLVTFTLPALTVASVTDLSLQSKIGWGSAILSDGVYDYVCGTEDADGFKFAHVARVPSGNGKVSLSWNASPSGLVYYWVYFRPQGHRDWFYHQFPASGTSFVATNLLNGFNYSFRVTAPNQAGQSPPSNEVTVKPMPPLPAKPAGFQAPSYAYNSRIPLSWDPNPVAGVSYSVEVRNASHDGAWSPRTTTRQTNSLFMPGEGSGEP